MNSFNDGIEAAAKWHETLAGMTTDETVAAFHKASALGLRALAPAAPEPTEVEVERVAAFMMGQCDPVWSQDEWPIANEEIKDKWRDRARAALAAMGRV